MTLLAVWIAGAGLTYWMTERVGIDQVPSAWREVEGWPALVGAALWPLVLAVVLIAVAGVVAFGSNDEADQ